MKIGVMLRHIQKQRGGIGTYTNNLIEKLFAIDKNNQYVLFYKNENIKYFSKLYPNVEEICINVPTKFIWDQISIPIKCKQENVDIIFNPKLSIPILSPLKKVFVMHGGDWIVFPKNYTIADRIYHNIFAGIYLRKADKVISVSKSASKDLIEHFKLKPEKIKTIYHGVGNNFFPISDTDKLQKIKKNYNLPDNFILFVGNIYPMKNFKGIVRAFSKIVTEFPHKLVVVGGRGKKHKQDLELIPKLNLEKEVIFLGWVPDEDLPGIYNLASFLSFPSLYEGFGIPIIEAMKCGCPVLTSNKGAPSEIAGDAALLVEPADVDSIAEGMRKLIVDKGLSKNLREKGFLMARKFTWENCAKEVLSIFESLNGN